MRYFTFRPCLAQVDPSQGFLLYLGPETEIIAHGNISNINHLTEIRQWRILLYDNYRDTNIYQACS